MTFSEYELYDFKLKHRRLLQGMDNKSLDLLYKIIKNIIDNPNEPKYKKISERKLNDSTVSWVLLSINFAYKIVDFEKKYIYESDDTEILIIILELINEQYAIINKRKLKHLNDLQKFQEREEYKNELLKNIKSEMISRSRKK